MHCSYCGKEIGTLRLLRDSEFCSASHRKSYKERLGRVLNQISDETKTPPPPPARFRTALTPIDGKTTYSMALWQAGHDYPFYGVSRWPMSLPTLAHLQPREMAGNPVAVAENGPSVILDLLTETTSQATYPELNLAAETGATESAAPEAEPEFAKAPPLCRTIVSCLPEVAERWLDRSLAAPLASVVACTTRALAVLPAAALHTTPHTASCAALPAAEPVAAWLQCADAASPMLGALELQLPAPIDALALEGTPELCGFLPVPAAEPVAAWLASAAAVQPAAFAFDLQLPAQLEAVVPLEIASAVTMESEAAFAEVTLSPVDSAVPAVLGAPMEFLAGVQLPGALGGIGNAGVPSATGQSSEATLAGPAAAPTFALSAPPSVSVPLLPALSLAAELEPLPEEPLVIPELCGQMMPTPQPEPVERFLYASSAAVLPVALPQARPVLAGDLIRTYVPVSNTVFPGLQAEPVMAGVWPRIAETPIENINTVPAFQLPGAAAMPAAFRGLSIAPAVSPVGQPATAAPAAAFHGVPAFGALPVELPKIAAVAGPSTPAALALSAGGPQPEFVETLTPAAAAGPIDAVPPVLLQEFQLQARAAAGIHVPQVPSLAARVAEPRQAQPRVLEIRPISTVRLAMPQHNQETLTAAVPRPGLVALEYHIHRMRSESYSRPEWKSVQFAPVPPEFALSAVLENLEELVRPKAAPVGVFPINTRNQRPGRSVMMGHILRIAAAITIITTIWGGAAALKNARRIAMRQEDTAFATPNQVLTPESQKAASNKAAEGKGPINWLRHTVANRASVQVAEDFQSGMPRWSAGEGVKPTNWRRNADGYVTTGALALFAPTSKFTDYKLEFFGQIESKSIGWVVRAKDDKNYHAMKFTTIERGLRPIIAMVHYSVIDGIMGKQTRTPLNVMVHNNKPFQVAVSVRGKRFVTEVDGEEVDTFSEDALNTGGVGFFSDAGEKARLYWARVTKNDDWLGHVCAFLSGGEAQATAEVWPASIPGSPSPWTPMGDNSILTAAIGLPTLRRTQSPQRQKRCNS